MSNTPCLIATFHHKCISLGTLISFGVTLTENHECVYPQFMQLLCYVVYKDKAEEILFLKTSIPGSVVLVRSCVMAVARL